jgi:exodeoxyribonuclease X
MSAVVLDTETTDASDEAKIIEFAVSERMDAPLQESAGVEVSCFRYSADRPIALGAIAAHHILDEDLVGFAPFPGWDPEPLGITYIIGHQVDFDWRMLGQPNVRRICTLALCRSLWPLADAHTLAAMIYHVHPYRQRAREIVRAAHNAKADVRMLLDVLLPRLLREHPTADTWEKLWLISENARVPTIMSFGKHKGMPIGDVPRDYKRWLLNQPDVDPYLAKALRA